MKKFDLQLFGATLPDNPSTAEATVGKDYLLYVNTGSVAAPEWTLVGGQRSSNLSKKADSIDVSHKTSGGWKSKKAGLKEWSIDLAGLVLLNDPGITALEQAFDEGKDAHIKLQYPDFTYRTGWVSISEFSVENPHDGAATLKGTLNGNGELTALIPAISPLQITVSKAAASDQVFAVVPSSTSVSSVTNGSNALVDATDYTYSSGSLTIKGTYLSGLPAGTVSLAVATGEGAKLVVTVVLTE